MRRAFNISWEDLEGRWVHAPIVDMLHYEPSIGAYVVTIVPNDHVSRQQKETVVLPLKTPEGERVTQRMEELSRLLGKGSTISFISHLGGADFTLHRSNGEVCTLSDEGFDPEATLGSIAALQDIAQAAEIAFVLASRTAA